MSDITRHGIAVFRIRRNSSNDVVVTVQGSWLDDWDQLEGDPITREKTYPNPHQAARDMPWFGAESTAQKTTQETAQRKIAASSKGKHTYVSRWEERGENDRKISIPEAPTTYYCKNTGVEDDANKTIGRMATGPASIFQAMIERKDTLPLGVFCLTNEEMHENNDDYHTIVPSKSSRIRPVRCVITKHPDTPDPEGLAGQDGLGGTTTYSSMREMAEAMKRFGQPSVVSKFGRRYSHQQLRDNADSIWRFFGDGTERADDKESVARHTYVGTLKAHTGDDRQRQYATLPTKSAACSIYGSTAIDSLYPHDKRPIRKTVVTIHGADVVPVVLSNTPEGLANRPPLRHGEPTYVSQLSEPLVWEPDETQEEWKKFFDWEQTD